MPELFDELLIFQA